MENSKHTKGAWKTSLNPLTKNKEYIIETVSDSKLIARVQSEEVSDEECEANANLISTANELLEALIEAYEEIKVLDKQLPMRFNCMTEKGNKYWNDFSDKMIRIENVINKANR